MNDSLISTFLPVTGLLLVLFLSVHLAGLVVGAVAPNLFELYAANLHASSWLGFIEITLLIIALIHIFLTFLKVISNYKKGNQTNLVSKRKDFLGVFSARFQPLGGVILLSFLIIHLEQFRFPRPSIGQELSSILIVLSSMKNLILYLLGSLALFFHLFHGIESSHRSLGLLSNSNALLIRTFGRGLSLLIGLGFLLIAFFLGGTSLLIN